jgi:hypothetical protein
MGAAPRVVPFIPGFNQMGTANGMYVYTLNPVPVANPAGGYVVHAQQHEVNQVLLEGLQQQQQQRDCLIVELDRAFAANSRIGSVLRKQNNQDLLPT